METYENAGKGTAVRARSPIGVRLAATVEELRKLRRLTQQELATKLKDLGRPMSTSAISKIEKGQRRVDPDDLVALAVALNVSPVRLLLDGQAGEVQMALTPELSVQAWQAWRWADGEAPLTPSALREVMDSVDLSQRVMREAAVDYRVGSRPPEFFQEDDKPLAAALDRVQDSIDTLLRDRVGHPYEDLRRTAGTARAQINVLLAEIDALVSESNPEAEYHDPDIEARLTPKELAEINDEEAEWYGR